VARGVHWPVAVPLTALTAPASPGAGVLPVQARDPLMVLPEQFFTNVLNKYFDGAQDEATRGKLRMS
jgi:hypothetical protein